MRSKNRATKIAPQKSRLARIAFGPVRKKCRRADAGFHTMRCLASSGYRG
jgi:hypothetical protein